MARHNQLDDFIPAELAGLSKLKVLLSHNNLSGSIPPELGDLVNLKNLHLNNNQLDGNIPEELGDLAKLKPLAARQPTGRVHPAGDTRVAVGRKGHRHAARPPGAAVLRVNVRPRCLTTCGP